MARMDGEESENLPDSVWRPTAVVRNVALDEAGGTV